MTSSSQNVSRFTRRILWLAAGIAVVVLAYTAAWFYFAHVIEQRVIAAIEEVDGNGVRAFCEEPEARGYPFRIGIVCSSVFYEDTDDGVSVRAGALESAANVYRPFQVLSQLEGPAQITLPQLVPLEARWESLRASARLADPLPERVSAEGRNVVVSASEGDGGWLARLSALQVHARQRGLDAEIAASFENLLLGEMLAPGLPALEGRGRALVENGISQIENGSMQLRGQSAVIQELLIGVVGSEAELGLSGPIAVDGNGLISAELSVNIQNPGAVAQVLAEVFPDSRENIMTAAAVFGNLGAAPIELRIVEGRVFLGFVPLGEIPAI